MRRSGWSAGDCVLQPPEIRHRVLRSSPGLEVIEISCPAEHDTIADHDLDLPTARVDHARDFAGQHFVRHVASDATATPWVAPDMVARDTGVAAATAGLAGAVVVSGDAPGSGGARLTHLGEFVLVVGLSGAAQLDIDGRAVDLESRASVALPAGDGVVVVVAERGSLGAGGLASGRCDRTRLTRPGGMTA